MEKKSKIIWVGIISIAILSIAIIFYRNNILKKNLSPTTASQNEFPKESETSPDSGVDEENVYEDISGDEKTNYSIICENGEWVKISDQSGTLSNLSGKLRKVYPDESPEQFKNYMFYIEGQENMGIAGQNLFRLDYFEDREVEIEGLKSAEKNEIAVSRVKCTGLETDKNVLGERRSLMSYIASNINSLAPQKAKYSKWTADIVDIIDSNHVYVEYYDTIEDEENSDVEDTYRKVLFENTSQASGKYNLKVLAYWEMGEDDYVLKSGTDKFEDTDPIASYQYDPEKKTWERID